MKYLFDSIRNKKLLLKPEEIVRQDLLKRMVSQLNYPKSLISIEVDLATLSHLRDGEKLPKRRADIICFGKNIFPSHDLYPLLIIECKACTLSSKAIDQVIGYNHFVKAFFIAVANSSEIRVFWYNNKDGRYDSVNFLPSYDHLIKVVR